MATGPLSRLLRHLHRSAQTNAGAVLSDEELLVRYTARQDEGAFEALLRRHGSMVFGVCRRVLGNDADAEDAFQATFLVLVRKGGSIRSPATLAGWLHGVARNVALKARAQALRRQLVEREAGAEARPGAFREGGWELWAVLDEELARLPEAYRGPLALCDLEGQTIQEAARRLGWPQGTAATRLRRGRALLARRLARRGWELPAVIGAVVGTPGALPAGLVSCTARAAHCFATDEVRACAVSAPVTELTAGVLRTMYLAKLKSASFVAALVCVGLGLAGAGIWPSRAAEQLQPAPAAKPAEKPAGNLRDTLLALDRHLWEAFARGDWQERAKFYADDLVTISVLGKYGKADNVASDKRLRCADWKVEDAEVIPVSKDVAVLNYRYGCKILSADGRVLETRKDHRYTCVWANRDGGWVQVFCFDDHGRGSGDPGAGAQNEFRKVLGPTLLGR